MERPTSSSVWITPKNDRRVIMVVSKFLISPTFYHCICNIFFFFSEWFYKFQANVTYVHLCREVEDAAIMYTASLHLLVLNMSIVLSGKENNPPSFTLPHLPPLLCLKIYINDICHQMFVKKVFVNIKQKTWLMQLASQ